MEALKLIGILIIVIGFAFRFNTIAVVTLAGLITGLLSGLGWHELLDVFGSAFIKNRYMTIFVLTLPAIGILEKYGLRERASDLMKKLKAATAGRIISLYLILRDLTAMFGLRLGGHVQFVRPLVLPMANGADRSRYGELDEEQEEDIKGLSAASENFGNFFGQNVFPAAGGVLLIAGTLGELGYEVDVFAIAKYSLIMAFAIMIVGSLRFFAADIKTARKMKKKGGEA